MPLDPFAPGDYGFPVGSPIFAYRPEDRRAINEARIRIQGGQAYDKFWECVLTSEERNELGNNVDESFKKDSVSINVLCRLRNWIPERAIVEIAYELDFLTPKVYERLRGITGDPVEKEPNPQKVTPTWDRKSGRLEFGGELCRDIRVAIATSVVPILDEFQDAGWPPTIEFLNNTIDPQQIHQVVIRLNNSLSQIRFRVQDQLICWYISPQSKRKSPAAQL